MTRIVTSNYRPKRAPRKKRKQPPIANRIVTPAKLKPLKGPVIRLRDQASEGADVSGADLPRRSAIVEPKRKRTTMHAHLLEDMTPEEHQRRGDGADALFREIVRRAGLTPEKLKP